MLRFGLLVVLLSFTGSTKGLSYYMEAVEMNFMSPEYFDEDHSDLEIIYLNSTFSGLSSNITITKTLPENTIGHVELFLKSMGEYTVSGGISISMTLCDMMDEPVLMGRLLKLMGIEDECPPPPGVYGVPLWYPSAELMPESLPGSDYKIIFTLTLDGETLLDVGLYCQVS